MNKATRNSIASNVYNEFSPNYPSDCILFVRMGFELLTFGLGALNASDVPDIELEEDYDGSPLVVVSMLDERLSSLIQAGYKLAIAEQVPTAQEVQQMTLGV
jgi:DNA mismatch repair ATPase MutS